MRFGSVISDVESDVSGFVVTGKSVSLDQKTNIVVPEDRDGLYAIDVLDPDMVRFVSYLCCSC